MNLTTTKDSCHKCSWYKHIEDECYCIAKTPRWAFQHIPTKLRIPKYVSLNWYKDSDNDIFWNAWYVGNDDLEILGKEIDCNTTGCFCDSFATECPLYIEI